MSRRVSPIGFLWCKHGILKESKHLHSSLDNKGKLVHEEWGETMNITDMRKGPFYMREGKYKT